ncbi:MAG: GIY-YIG nuclease family protein [Fimbriimonadaceae bacterium]
MWRVYILRSRSTGRFYVGCTDRIDRRLAEHNAGQTPSTRGRGPWELAYAETFGTRREALERERQIKSWKSHRSIQELIDRHG